MSLVQGLVHGLVNDLTEGIVPNGGGGPSATTRYFTTFNSSAQSYISLSSSISFAGDFKIECYCTLKDGGYLFGNRNSTDIYNRLVIRPGEPSTLYGMGFDGDFADIPVSFKLNKIALERTGSNITLFLNDNIVAQTSSSLTFTIDAIGSQFGGTTTIPYWQGIIADLKIWTGGDDNTGTLVIDSPIDGVYNSQRNIVENNQAVFISSICLFQVASAALVLTAQNITDDDSELYSFDTKNSEWIVPENAFGPTELGSGWADSGDQIYTKTDNTVSSNLGEFWSTAGIKTLPNTTYRVKFTIDAVESDLSLFTQSSSAVSVIPNMTSNDYDQVVSTLGNNGLWFNKSSFVGTVSNVSFNKILEIASTVTIPNNALTFQNTALTFQDTFLTFTGV